MKNKELSWTYLEGREFLEKHREERHSYTIAGMYELSAWMRDFEKDFENLLEKYKHERN